MCPIADAELNEAADNITSAISTMVSDLNAGKERRTSYSSLCLFHSLCSVSPVPAPALLLLLPTVAL